MAELYSGAYEFGEPEEAAPVPRQQHQTLGDGPIESPARLEEEDDSPPVSPPPSPPGPLPVLYVRSERLQQLSRRLPVNADRPELLHGLVEAYGLLEVRGQAGKWVARPAGAAGPVRCACQPPICCIHSWLPTLLPPLLAVAG